MKKMSMLLIALVLFAVPALAETVRVECIGEVEYNQVNSGLFGDVNAGDAVYATFTVDSDNYIDSATYNTRGYVINLESFELTIGSVGPVPLVIPQPNGDVPLFVLRESDPVSDGFFLANNTDWPQGNPYLDVPAQLDDYFGFHWEVGYEGDTLSSLDILDALGSYDFDGLTSFYTAIQDAWADAMGLIYGEIIISSDVVATENSSWSELKSLYR